MARTASLAWFLLGLCLSRPALADKPTSIPCATTQQVHQAVDRAISYLQSESAAWLNTRKCAACHHVPMPLWALAEAGRRGYAIDTKFVAGAHTAHPSVKSKILGSSGLPRAPPPPSPRP